MMYRLKKILLLLNGQNLLMITFVAFLFSLFTFFVFLYNGDESNLFWSIIMGFVVYENICSAEQQCRIDSLQEQVADLKDRLCLAEHEAENCRLELEARREAAEKRKAARRKRKENSHEDENKD